MGDGPVHIVVASFADEEIARQAFWDLKMDKRGKLIEFQDAALVERDEDNKIHIKETADMDAGRGATFGSIVGLFLGSLVGPAGVIIGSAAGAVVGGITAKAFDTGIPDERLEELAEAIQPEKSIIVVVVPERWLADIIQHLEDDSSEVITETLKEDVIKHFIGRQE